MRKLFSLAFFVSFAGGALASNPGTFEYFVPTMYQDGTSWTTLSGGRDGKIVLGNVQHANTGEVFGGYGVEFQINVSGDPFSPGSSGTIQIARELTVNAYARYVPAGNEAPAGPFDVSVLQAKATALGFSPLDFDGGGYAEVSHNEETLAGSIPVNSGVVQNSFGFAISGNTVQFTHDQESTTPVSGIFQLANGHWVATTVPGFTEHTSRILWDVPPAKSMSASLRAYKISKVTYVDGQQLSHGWIPEDIDANGEIGASDLSRLFAAYDTVVADPNYDRWADVNQDGEVGAADFSQVALYYDQPYTFGVEVLGLSTTMDVPFGP